MNWPSQETIYVTLAVSGLCVTGLIKLISRRIHLHRDIEFATNFRHRFIEYCNGGHHDQVQYNWLIARSSRLQNAMGGHGVIHAFRPPHANYIFNNYPVALNVLPEIRKLSVDNQFGQFNNLIEQYDQLLDDSLIRYVGSFEELETNLTRSLRNPIVRFREGVRFFVASPIMVLVWLGVLGTSTLARLIHGVVFRLIAASTSVIALISAIFTILLGWKEMKRIVFGWFY